MGLSCRIGDAYVWLDELLNYPSDYMKALQLLEIFTTQHEVWNLSTREQVTKSDTPLVAGETYQLQTKGTLLPKREVYPDNFSFSKWEAVGILHKGKLNLDF